jgi:deazaflavin-dependent oxidoreductase (nitroreductase family)
MDMSEVNRQVIEAFRDGVDPPGMHRDRLLLLTTRGARTGKPHTAPMMFHRDAERVFVIASADAAPNDPQWYRNLVADPHVRVELADEAYSAFAVSLKGAERDHTWTEIKRLYPFFADHEAKVEREIPVVELRRERDVARVRSPA